MSAPKPAKPVPPAERAQIVELPQGPAPVAAHRAQARRRRWLALSALLCVLLPSLLGALYYGRIASDRYVAGAGFAVRGVSAASGLDGIGALTGLVSSGSTTSDSYIILKYLRSRELVERLDHDMGLRAAMSAPTIDPLSRLRPDRRIEEVVDYWDRRISTAFDATSGVVTFEVEAFSPAQAQQIAGLTLGYVRDLVNRLSAAARADAVRFAETEVARAETRLRAALADLRAFRETEQSINPTASAQLDIELVSALEARLIDLRTRMAALKGRVGDDTPILASLQRQADAVAAQIAERTAVIGGPGAAGTQGAGAAMSALLADYEALEVERNFAQQSYASALTSLEQARMEADRQQRYLAVYARPDLPEKPLLPQRALSAGLVALVAAALWGIAALLVYAVRDHLS